MKNVKILLLLGVMLVNVMPYINHGKVEWKTAQAEAQNYTIEYITSLDKYLCWNSADLGIYPFFYSNTLCELTTNSTSTTNPTRPTLTIYKHSIDEEVIKYANKSSWCVFYCMAVLYYSNPCSIASWYYSNYRKDLQAIGCDPDVPATKDRMDAVYSKCNASLGSSISSSTAPDELVYILKSTSAILRLNDLGTYYHMSIVYGIEEDSEQEDPDKLALVFDTNNGQGPFYKKVKVRNVVIPSENHRIY